MSQITMCDCTHQYSDRTEIISIAEKIELPFEKDDRLIFNITLSNKNGHNIEHVSKVYVCERIIKLANIMLNQLKDKEVKVHRET